ncbi:MAG: hypothetical protein ACYC64_19855 [Armatimonadota bacterium]
MKYLYTLNRGGIRASIRRGDILWLDPQYLVTREIEDYVRSHWDQIVAEIRGCAVDASESAPEIVPDYHLLMVATNLDSWEADDPRFGHEVMLDVCYRQLDAPYYAWLRHRTENARRAHEAGALDDAAFDGLRERFNAIHSWAVQHIGEEALRHAIRTADVKSYVQPSEATFAAYRKTWDDAWNQYQRRHATPVNAATSLNPLTQLNNLLSTRGYAAIQSDVLDDFVIIVRDDNVAVPIKWAAKVRFTVDEVNLLTDTSPEAIKRICELKQKFGGTVVPADDCPFKDDGPGNERAAIQQSLFTTEAGTCA